MGNSASSVGALIGKVESVLIESARSISEPAAAADSKKSGDTATTDDNAAASPRPSARASRRDNSLYMHALGALQVLPYWRAGCEGRLSGLRAAPEISSAKLLSPLLTHLSYDIAQLAESAGITGAVTSGVPEKALVDSVLLCCEALERLLA